MYQRRNTLVFSPIKVDAKIYITQGRVPRGRFWHPLSAGHQGPAQGNAAGGGQAADPVRGRRGLCRGHPRHDLCHRPQQARHRRPLRHRLRTGKRARGQRQDTNCCDIARSVHARRHELLLRAPAAHAGPGPCGAVRRAPGRQRAFRGAAGRRPDGRPAGRPAGAGADGGAFERLGSSVLAVQEVPLDQVKRYGIVAGERVGKTA